MYTYNKHLSVPNIGLVIVRVRLIRTWGSSRPRSSSCTSEYIPLADRKSGMPHETEMPAPQST